MPSTCAARAGHRVIVPDDDVLLREGLASLLGETGYDVVGAGQSRSGWWLRTDSSSIFLPPRRITAVCSPC